MLDSDSLGLQYTITTGTHDGYKIVAFLRAPFGKTISDLYPKFLKEHFVNYQPDLPSPKSVTDMRLYQKNLDYKYDAVRKLRNSGYEGNTIVDLFISWLIKEHNFQEERSNEVWIES
jgi:hypothetical protein